MNNPEDLPLDIEEQRGWINAHKKDTGMPWSVLATKTGIAQGTISVFAGGSYAGDNRRIAEAVFRYRQLLQQQSEIEYEVPELPGFFETPTTRRIERMLTLAQRGRITLVAAGPGNSKTQTLRNYRDSVANVWLSTMAPSTSGLNTMQIAVLASMGEPMAKGTPQALSRRICERVMNSGGLIEIDEAQHLSEKALEEIRSWHDMTGVGICLVGNRDVLLRLEHGSRKEAFARLASRVSQRLVFEVASDGDAAAFCDAWKLEEDSARRFITDVAKKPGSLRNATMVMETASMLAYGERSPVGLAHLQDAWAMLSTRQIAA